MNRRVLGIRRGTVADLAAINAVIESAVMNWPVADRVKRLSLPSLKYDEIDLTHLETYLYMRGDEVIGVATLDVSYQSRSGLLHGLYVLPIVQGQGIGMGLMQEAFEFARHSDLDVVLIRAERFSAGYFRHKKLDVITPANDSEYPYQFSKSLNQAA